MQRSADAHLVMFPQSAARQLMPGVSPCFLRKSMSGRMNKVILVLEPAYGNRLVPLASTGHVWVIDTPENRVAASGHWAQRPEHKVEYGVTTFKSSGDATRLEMCLGILGTIGLHHGEYASNPPYSVLEVVGLPLTDEAQSAVEDFGFRSFESTTEGFRAAR